MDLDVDGLWKQCSEAIRTSGSEVIGLQKQQRTSAWRDHKYKDVVCVKV